MLLIRYDPGEEVLSSLTTFCSERSIFAGTFSGIGAAKEVVLSYYNLPHKQYQDTTINEDVEIVSLLGNIATMDGKVVVHCHGSFGDSEYTPKAGHVKKLIVSATCEITVQVLQGKLERAYDEKTGLNILK